MVKFLQNNVSIRIVSGVVLALLTLIIIIQGVRASQGLVIVCILGSFIEWTNLCFRISKAPINRRNLWAIGAIYMLVAGVGFFRMVGADVSIPWHFLQILILVIASDVGAFFVGTLIGGPKLAPAISPNKTWSGALGGFCAAILVTTLFSLVLNVEAIPAAFLVFYAILAQGGDLLESWVKRRLAVKDTSSLIPGHGGLLDRFDSLLPIGFVYFFKSFL
ncbi:phosphatidate cytidylyltransferase [Candidatus Nucleicultrix amoebiphila]|uniref:phosphatidate cytidylyltransferase n=1 Tax=Candidatus Nucleicultrix amoebiphila TaxID=1509244 RepID=UPI000A27146F|nr:phosphatidate cytidylyltransferase [Candidatus Nucleicultrix amoebiphila]